ncbi:hypothetical protein [Prevotella corporis]|uniref:hypothetical protein n=1 Tax=Prevotella corporis TaxID=28128 RepID=UPI000A429F16|nr:hypothetical protein [Prevotella corporis]
MVRCSQFIMSALTSIDITVKENKTERPRSHKLPVMTQTIGMKKKTLAPYSNYILISQEAK